MVLQVKTADGRGWVDCYTIRNDTDRAWAERKVARNPGMYRIVRHW